MRFTEDVYELRMQSRAYPYIYWTALQELNWNVKETRKKNETKFSIVVYYMVALALVCEWPKYKISI